MSDLAADYDTLRNGVGAVWTRREVIRITGPEALSYLQGQVTQDLDRAAIGQSIWSFVLQPHGKVDGFLRLTRTAEFEFIVDVDAGQTAKVIERLERFKLRTKVELTPLSWKVLAIRGAKANVPPASDVVVADATWRSITGFDLLGENVGIPEGIRECDSEALEAQRIEAGMPVMGAELDELTIPAEAGANDLAISFTKGCYTGQELVARIDSRGGNVPRHLRLIVFQGDEHVPRGATIVTAGSSIHQTGGAVKPFGSLTSVAYSPGREAFVGLALIRRDVLPPVEAKLLWHDGPTPCTIEALPSS